MSLDDFIAKYNGKGIDFDGAFGAQCVDLYRQYVKEVLGYPQSPPVEGAKDIWGTYLPEYYQRVENTPYGVPEKGDVVIFGTGLGKYGHVSIFIEGTASKFTSFDQNYPLGSLCHKQGHTYKGVLGWLKPLKKDNNMPTWFDKFLQENNLTLNDEGKIREIFGKAKDYDDKIKELTEQVKSANETLSDKSAEVALLITKVDKLENKVIELTEQFNTARSERDTFSWEKEKLEILNKKLEEENESFKQKNDIMAYTFFQRLVSLLRR